MYTVTRYHDISCGHRVVGHEGKCRYLHGHNYRIHFTCGANTRLDNIGRVIDFGEIKQKLCMWLEDNWDHKFLAWEEDKVIQYLISIWENDGDLDLYPEIDSFIIVPFNPTAENIAQHLVEVVGEVMLKGTDVELITVKVDETRKCSATYTKE